MTQKTIGVLAIQGAVSEHEDKLRAVGANPAPVHRRSDLEGLDGIIIPGGESTTISKLLQISGLFEPLKNVIEQGLPAWGTCAGMILLADQVDNTRDDSPSLGGLDIAVRRNAFGRQKNSFEAQLQVDGVDGLVDALFIRAPEVVEVGKGVTVLSRVHRQDDSGDAIVAVSQDHILATSFHPELTPDTKMHKFFLDRFTS